MEKLKRQKLIRDILQKETRKKRKNGESGDNKGKNWIEEGEKALRQRRGNTGDQERMYRGRRTGKLRQAELNHM